MHPFLFGEVQIKDTLIALFIVARDLCILASITNFPGAKSIWKFWAPKKESHCLNGSPAWKSIARHTVPTIWTTTVILKLTSLTWEVESKTRWSASRCWTEMCLPRWLRNPSGCQSSLCTGNQLMKSWLEKCQNLRPLKAWPLAQLKRGSQKLHGCKSEHNDC